MKVLTNVVRKSFKATNGSKEKEITAEFAFGHRVTCDLCNKIIYDTDDDKKAWVHWFDVTTYFLESADDISEKDVCEDCLSKVIDRFKLNSKGINKDYIEIHNRWYDGLSSNITVRLIDNK